MKSRIIIVMLGGLVIGLTGCANGPYAGVVGWNKDFSSGSLAPDLPLTLAEGKETRFSKIRQSFAILAFTSPPSQKCCSLRPDLVELANQRSLVRWLLRSQSRLCSPINSLENLTLVISHNNPAGIKTNLAHLPGVRRIGYQLNRKRSYHYAQQEWR